MTNVNEKIEFLNKYFNLVSREIPLSMTGISSRVFFYLKEKGLTKHVTVDFNKRSPRVKLNYFEAIWLLIIKDLRAFGLPDKHVKVIHDFLFTNGIDLLKNQIETIDTSIEVFKAKNEHLENSIKQIDTEMIENLIKQIPEDEFVFFSNIGRIFQLIQNNQQPELWIAIEEDTKNNEDFSIIVNLVSNEEIADKNLHPIFEKKNTPKLILPLLNYYEKLFETDIKTETLRFYQLITEREKQILDIIEKKEFKELKIKKTNDNITINQIKDGEITGSQVKAIKRILGCGDFQDINLKFRNDKHIYYVKTE